MTQTVDGLQFTLDDAKLQKLIRESPGLLDNALKTAAIEIVRDIQQSMGTSPPGRKYPRGRGRSHIASRPTFPPNVDLGTLRASIHFRKEGDLRYRVSDQVEYGAWLEFGTPSVAPRPWLRPAIERERPRFNDRIDFAKTITP